jgi:hypothetical protein
MATDTIVPTVPTQLNICAAACVLIGSTPITSFDQASGEARVANQLYHKIVERELTQMPWSFASGYADLGEPLADVPVTRWGYAYSLPQTPQLLVTFGVQVGDEAIAFEERDQKIFCDASSADNPSILYGFRAAEARFKPYFTMALIEELAGYFASSVTMNSGLAKVWLDLAAEKSWPMARLKDSQARTPRPPAGLSRFVRARRGV